jgi:hypothetical protein
VINEGDWFRPRLDGERERAKQILLAIVRHSGGKLRGRDRLFYIFYFAHLIYAKRHPDRLSMWPIVCIDWNLTIHRARELITELVDEGALKRRRGPDHDYYEDIIFIAPRKDIPLSLSPDAVEAICVAIKFTQGRERCELGRWIFRHSQSLRIAREGEPMHIYIDRLPDCEYDPQWRTTVSRSKDHNDAQSCFVRRVPVRSRAPHAGRRLWIEKPGNSWLFKFAHLNVGPL